MVYRRHYLMVNNPVKILNLMPSTNPLYIMCPLVEIKNVAILCV